MQRRTWGQATYAATHMGTGTLVRATPHKLPVPMCSGKMGQCIACFPANYDFRVSLQDLLYNVKILNSIGARR